MKFTVKVLEELIINVDSDLVHTLELGLKSLEQFEYVRHLHNIEPAYNDYIDRESNIVDFTETVVAEVTTGVNTVLSMLGITVNMVDTLHSRVRLLDSITTIGDLEDSELELLRDNISQMDNIDTVYSIFYTKYPNETIDIIDVTDVTSDYVDVLVSRNIGNFKELVRYAKLTTIYFNVTGEILNKRDKRFFNTDLTDVINNSPDMFNIDLTLLINKLVMLYTLTNFKDDETFYNIITEYCDRDEYLKALPTVGKYVNKIKELKENNL